MHHILKSLMILLVAIPVVTGSATAQPTLFEDFISTNYRDGANTSADWDTTSGTLTHGPFQFVNVNSQFGLANGQQRVTSSGDLFYIGAGSSGMHVMKFDNGISQGALLDTYNTSGYTRNIRVEGGLAYLADGLPGLVILDVTNPTTSTFVGSYNTADYAWDVAISGDIAYVADGNSGIRVIDVSNPASPSLITSLALGGKSFSMALAGDLLYVAAGAAGLMVVDVTDPAVPFVVGSYNTPGSAGDVIVEGDLAYLADGNTGLVVIDVSNPAAPALVATVGTAAFASTLSVSGNRAYVACGSSGVDVFDVSDPALPLALGSIAPTAGDSVTDIVVAGDMAYCTQPNTGISITRIADIVAPHSVGSVTMTFSWAQATDLCVAGDIAVVTDSQTGLHVVDISNPNQPVILGAASLTGGGDCVAVSGNYAFVGTDFDLHVVDITNPTLPNLVGTGDSGFLVHDIAISGNYAYVASGIQGMEVFDISDPTDPTFVVGFIPGSDVREIAVAGNYVYLGDTSAKVRIIDVSNPVSPATIYTYNTGISCNDIEVANNYLYLCIPTHSVRVLDVSNPAAPVVVGTYTGSHGSQDIEIAGYVGVLAGGSSGLSILDLTNPASISSIMSPLNDGQYRKAIAVSGENIFAANTQQGLEGLRFMQSVADLNANVAQSTTMPDVAGPVTMARITPWSAGSVEWEVSIDNGSVWQPINAGQWLHFDTPDSGLKWRSTLNWSKFNTTVYEMTVDWLYEFGFITAVNDLPGDQGGQVRLEWARSGRDYAGDSQQIVEYAIYREIAPGAKAAAAEDLLVAQSAAVQMHAQSVKSAGWDFVTTVPVRVQDEYAVIVPTVADSSVTGGQHFSSFMVSALTATPGVFFDSPADSGYSVDNLVPGAPQALVAGYQADSVELDWDDAVEEDFRYFRIYRDTDPAFVPNPANLVKESGVSLWTDPTSSPWDYHYKVTTVDFSGNESDPSSVTTVSGVPGVDQSARFALGNATPNPFNPATTLSFELPANSMVDLSIYDLAGRLVITLVHEDRDAGNYRVVWDGRNASGGLAASGVYLYRLQAGNHLQTRRMTLMK